MKERSTMYLFLDVKVMRNGFIGGWEGRKSIYSDVFVSVRDNMINMFLIYLRTTYD